MHLHTVPCYRFNFRIIKFSVGSIIHITGIVGIHSWLEQVDGQSSILIKAVAADSVTLAVVVGDIYSASTIMGNDISLLRCASNYCQHRSLRNANAIHAVWKRRILHIYPYFITYYNITIRPCNIDTHTHLHISCNDIPIHRILVGDTINNYAGGIRYCIPTRVISTYIIINQ